MAEFEQPPPLFWGSTTDLPEDSMLKKISEIPEFCCESKENEKSKKKSKNIKVSRDGVTTRVRLIFLSPRNVFSGYFFITKCGVLQPVLLQRSPVALNRWFSGAKRLKRCSFVSRFELMCNTTYTFLRSVFEIFGSLKKCQEIWQKH